MAAFVVLKIIQLLKFLIRSLSPKRLNIVNLNVTFKEIRCYHFKNKIELDKVIIYKFNFHSLLMLFSIFDKYS